MANLWTELTASGVYAMVRNGKERENHSFSLVAATFEKAITYVFAGRLIRNAEASGFDPPLLHHLFQPFTAAVIGGCFGQVANTWHLRIEFLAHHPIETS
ncbi:MAG TPA: hypothetical protein VFH31_13875 [Pyrinomonadaceae bacterium]|nr:hypothetical protein [Pyrinomonadaceae bacterium]